MIAASDPMSAAVIHLRGVQKAYRKHAVLAGVDLEVPRGAVFGFLGLNGAGKSTTIRIILGLLGRDGGDAQVLGLDPADAALEVRRRVGYMAENQTMYGWMRVEEIIAWCGRFYPRWDAKLADELREHFGLARRARVGTLSKGQTSQLALLLALAPRPELVILDDPVLGLDPISRRAFLRDIVSQLQAREVTVFFSSHLLYEIEPICDAVAILHEGRIVAGGPVDELREKVKRVVLRATQPGHLSQTPTLLSAQSEGARWVLTVGDIDAARPALVAASAADFEVEDLNLDEIFEAHVTRLRPGAAGGPEAAMATATVPGGARR